MSGRYRRIVTGINLCYKENKLTVKKEFKNMLRSELYHYAKNPNSVNENRILGMLCFVRNIDTDRYKYFKLYYSKIIESKKN